MAFRYKQTEAYQNIINDNEKVEQWIEACKELNLDPSSISKVCKGKLKQTHGYKFRYAVVNNKE